MLTIKLLITVAVICGDPWQQTRPLTDALNMAISQLNEMYDLASKEQASEEQTTDIAEISADSGMITEPDTVNDNQSFAMELAGVEDDVCLSAAPMSVIDDERADVEDIGQLIEQTVEQDEQVSDSSIAAAAAYDFDEVLSDISPAVSDAPAVSDEQDAEVDELVRIQQQWPHLDQQTRNAILLLVRADQLMHETRMD